MADKNFESIIRKHRRRLLVWTQESSTRLDGILRAAADDITRLLYQYAGTGKLQEAYLQALLVDINRVMDDLHSGYDTLMPVHLGQSAQIAADRELAVLKKLYADSPSLTDLSDGLAGVTEHSVNVKGVGQLTVTLGRVAEYALDAEYRRVLADGLTLSDRLWKLDAANKKGIEDTILKGIAEGKPSRELATDLRRYLTDKGVENARKNAFRLAHTEMAHAHREGHIQSVHSLQSGLLKPHVLCIGYRLSGGHRILDVCDIWASQDVHGLGAGNYTPEAVPIDHPNGLCYTVTVTKDHPENQYVEKQPEPDALPDRHYKSNGMELPKHRETLNHVEKDIRDIVDSEHGYVVNAAGEVILSKQGTVTHIGFSENERQRMRDAYFTHNHPSGRSFSGPDEDGEGDIGFAAGANLRQMRVSSPYGKYIMTRPERGWSAEMWYNEIKPSYAKHYQAVRNELERKIAKRELSSVMAQEMQSHLTWIRVAEETGLHYRREKWPGRMLP